MAGSWKSSAIFTHRAVWTAALAAALACLAAALSPAASHAASPNCSSFSNGLGTYKAGNWPGACWRPYNDSSPFNLKLSRFSPVVPGSRGIVNNLLAGGEVSHLVTGDPERDGGIAVFWSQPTDPVYTLDCTTDWGTCDIEGLQVRVPAEANPAGFYASEEAPRDSHMTIVDQQSGWEYDLFSVQSKADGVIKTAWGGRTRIDGDGLGSAAISAGYGSFAGVIRPEELQAGVINHALLMYVPCTDTYVYPAQKRGFTCDAAGLPPSGIPQGGHFQLAMSKKAIRRLDVPKWKEAILTALATYGAYVSDTSGVADQWGFERLSDSTYTSFGATSRWETLGKQLGLSTDDYNENGYREYWFEMPDGVPWKRLRMVDTCTAYGNCPAVSKMRRAKVRASHCRRGLVRWVKRRVRPERRADRRRLDRNPAYRKRVNRKRDRWSKRCRMIVRRAA